MGKTIRASVLIILLACTARADWMQNGAPAAPPPPATATQEPTGGEMPNDAPGTLTQIALDLLAVLPSLL